MKEIFHFRRNYNLLPSNENKKKFQMQFLKEFEIRSLVSSSSQLV